MVRYNFLLDNAVVNSIPNMGHLLIVANSQNTASYSIQTEEK
jgi:hypothetical protein